MSEGKLILGDVTIKKIVRGQVVELQVRAPGADTGIAIDTMLMAILQMCCVAGVSPQEVIDETATRMGQLSQTLILDPEQVDA